MTRHRQLQAVHTVLHTRCTTLVMGTGSLYIIMLCTSALARVLTTVYYNHNITRNLKGYEDITEHKV